MRYARPVGVLATRHEEKKPQPQWDPVFRPRGLVVGCAHHFPKASFHRRVTDKPDASLQDIGLPEQLTCSDNCSWQSSTCRLLLSSVMTDSEGRE